MSALEYIGSRREEIEAMLAEVGARLSDSRAHPSAPTAGAARAEAVGAPYVTASDLRVDDPGLREDVDAVEHLRQNRLRSWQKPADIGHRRF